MRVTVLGTGSMGSALCVTLASRGHEVTVWNRSGDLPELLAAAGARMHKQLDEALRASPLVLVVISSYAAARELLAEHTESLAGRMIIVPMIGTGEDVRNFADFTHDSNASYLDAGIECYPQDIGTTDALINVSGDESVWRTCEGLLKELGGRASYLGTDTAAAMLAEAVAEAFINPARGAFLEAISFARAVGLTLDQALPTLLHTLAYFQNDLQQTAIPAISAGDFSTARASLDVELEAARVYRQQMIGAGQRASLMTANIQNLEIARAAGLGNASVYSAVLTNAIRPS